MKKVLSVLFVLLLATSVFSAFAISADEWTALPGFKVSGEVIPTEVSEVSEGLQMITKGMWLDSDVSVAGVSTKEKKDVDNLKAVIKLKEAPNSGDVWVSIALMDKPNLFTKVAGDPAGYFVLIRKSSDTEIVVNSYIDNSTTTFNPAGEAKAPGKLVDSDITFEVLKEGDTYSVYVNNTKVAENINASVFPEGKAHVTVSASNGSDTTALTTIIKSVSNDATPKETASSEAASSQPASSAASKPVSSVATSSNASSSDEGGINPGLIIGIIVAVIVVVVVVFVIVSKKKE